MNVRSMVCRWAWLLAFTPLLMVGGAASAQTVPPPVRERLLLDSDWRFALGHAQDPKADFNYGADRRIKPSFLAKQRMFAVGSPDFDDASWKPINLPYDWGMDLPFDQKADWNYGSRPLGRNFPATSVGWYRKKFTIPLSDQGRRIAVEFDGVFQQGTVFCNGILMGFHHGGYESFQLDVTDALQFGGTNELVVRVDAGIREGWWYEGAGIYRHVWLTKTAPVHVAPWGTQIIAETDKGQAKVTARIEIRNESGRVAKVEVQTAVVDAEGKTVATVAARPGAVEPGDAAKFATVLNVPSPRLWSLEAPNLYQLVTTVKADDKVVDTTQTTFGIRSIAFDPDKGFLLNGKPVKIKGVCDHQQHAGVGVAMPDALYDWRIKQMQAMGANAIRMSHNQPAPEFLDACDRLGMLVMDEQRLFSSGEEGLRQLASMVRRDRNHPSIIIWSAGNEEWGLQDSEASGPILAALQNTFHRMDPTRPVTYAGSNGGYLLGANQVADVRGVNYFFLFKGKSNATTVGTVDAYHAKYPQQPIIGTEDRCGDASSWNFVASHDYYSGLFIWTGFAYYGESRWPNISGWGAVDMCGFPRKAYSYYRKVWAGKEDPKAPEGGTAAALAGAPDRRSIRADGEDLAVVTIRVVDAIGQRVVKAQDPFEVKLSGPGRILAIANGNDQSHELRDPAHGRSFNGQAQVLVQATREAGTIELEIQSEGLAPTKVSIPTIPSQSRPWVP